MSNTTKRFSFPRKMRLIHQLQFRKVYKSNVRVRIESLLMYGLPNDCDSSRLGLAVPQRVGTAVVRNTIKRRLREAFRLLQHDSPCCYDVVIQVRPNDPMKLSEYQAALEKGIRKLHSTWKKRETQSKSTR